MVSTQTERRYFQTKKEVKAWLAGQGITAGRISMSRGRFHVRVEGLPPRPEGVQMVQTMGIGEAVYTFQDEWRPVPTIFMGDSPLMEQRRREYDEEQDRLQAAGLLEPRPLTEAERAAAQAYCDRMNELHALSRGTNVYLG